MLAQVGQEVRPDPGPTGPVKQNAQLINLIDNNRQMSFAPEMPPVSPIIMQSPPMAPFGIIRAPMMLGRGAYCPY